jgi:hypothetical protein
MNQGKPMTRTVSLTLVVACLALFSACRETRTVTPASPSDQTETNTTVVNPPAGESQTHKESETTTTVTTEASPSP